MTTENVGINALPRVSTWQPLVTSGVTREELTSPFVDDFHDVLFKYGVFIARKRVFDAVALRPQENRVWN